jgi:hypothetical protein
MECKEYMNIFFELDNGEKPSPELAGHPENCPRCAQEIRSLNFLMESLKTLADIRPEGDIVSAVMARIAEPVLPSPEEMFSEKRLELSLWNWVGTGLFILAGMLLIPFSTILPALSRILPGLGIALPLVLGLLITVYAMLFAGSHMETLRRFLRMEHN